MNGFLKTFLINLTKAVIESFSAAGRVLVVAFTVIGKTIDDDRVAKNLEKDGCCKELDAFLRKRKARRSA